MTARFLRFLLSLIEKDITMADPIDSTAPQVTDSAQPAAPRDISAVGADLAAAKVAHGLARDALAAATLAERQAAAAAHALVAEMKAVLSAIETDVGVVVTTFEALAAGAVQAVEGVVAGVTGA